MLLSGVPGDK